MPSIRKTRTASGAIAVQVVRYANRKVVVLKHIGSGQNPQEVAALVESAESWMRQQTGQRSLFEKSDAGRTLPLATVRYKGATHAFAYAALQQVAQRIGLTTLDHALLLDLSFMRLIEPTSKRRAVELLERYFGIRHAPRTVYRALPEFQKLKAHVENIAVGFAQDVLSMDLSLVLYDVTTLYFETFKADELRVPGFSKDNKSQQPQIIVGLLVTREGFPLGYEVFRGNTFEGKTMVPILEAFASLHGVRTPTVVADAAMLSLENVMELEERGLSYIVGARIASASVTLISKLSAQLKQTDKATTRTHTKHGDLVCAFSAKRFRKDKTEMEKQIVKGTMLVERGEPGKRAKFVKRANKKDTYMLNEALIAKTKLLLGLKGYYTNIPQETLSNQQVIDRYHDLWHVEAAFRMAKSDLATRPIFHYKHDAVRAHLLVCFVALVMGKYLEVTTGLSLKRTMDLLWSVTDAHLVDTSTNEAFFLRSELDEPVRELMKKLRLSY